MGFSLVAATAIVGVAVLISLELIVGTTIPTITDVHDSYDEMRDRSIEQLQTGVNITSVSTPANDSNYDLNITIENTGSITLKTQYFNILINGTKYNYECDKEYLYPTKQVYFNVRSLEGNGNRILKIITNNGISKYYEYTIS
jgi:archaellum component FlaF (FlaF/FlaG flagellin family)